MRGTPRPITGLVDHELDESPDSWDLRSCCKKQAILRARRTRRIVECVLPSRKFALLNEAL
jgi:hypothetical protein